MRAAAWDEEGRLVVERRPELLPAQDETLVRVIACGICGSDLHAFHVGSKPAAGVVPGHEIAGVVEAGGELPRGTAVAVEPVLACESCPTCLSGMRQLCPSRKLLGFGKPGGFQEVLAVPSERVFALPGGVDPKLGAMAEPLAVCLRGVHLAGLPQGGRVLVLGAGTIGLLTVLLLREVAGEIAVTAKYPHQAEVALAFGAARVLEPGSMEQRTWTVEKRPDLVVETVGGEANTLADAVMGVRAGGTVLALGVFTGRPGIPAFRLVNDEVRLIGSITYGMWGEQAEFGVATGLVGRYRTELERLQTHWFALEEANDAFEAALDKTRGALKVTVLPGE